MRILIQTKSTEIQCLWLSDSRCTSCGELLYMLAVCFPTHVGGLDSTAIFDEGVQSVIGRWLLRLGDKTLQQRQDVLFPAIWKQERECNLAQSRSINP